MNGAIGRNSRRVQRQRHRCAAQFEAILEHALRASAPSDGNWKQMAGKITSQFSRIARPCVGAIFALGALTFAVAAPALAQYRQPIGNDMNKCTVDGGPAVMVTVDGIKSSTGRVRVQSYRATASEWLAKGRWLNRIEVPARAGTMRFCMPVPAAGSYGIAVRHDANGNGETDLSKDGGAMSNNPSINILNLGKPNFRKTAVSVGNEVKAIRIQMRYM
jgi:uncharacterized protein (DUF2141 family)